MGKSNGNKKSLLVCGKEVVSNGYVIPEFELYHGELLQIRCPLYGNQNKDGPQIICDRLLQGFQGLQIVESLSVYTKFKLAQPVVPRGLKEMFFPLTLNQYTKKNRIPIEDTEFLLSLCDLSLEIRFQQLPFSYRIFISALKTLNQSERVLINTKGIDHENSIRLQELITRSVKKGKTVVLFDNSYFHPLKFNLPWVKMVEITKLY